MKRHLIALVFCSVLTAMPAAAQDRPATLATLFEDIFGPRGLVVASQDVQLDGRLEQPAARGLVSQRRAGEPQRSGGPRPERNRNVGSQPGDSSIARWSSCA